MGGICGRSNQKKEGNVKQFRGVVGGLSPMTGGS